MESKRIRLRIEKPVSPTIHDLIQKKEEQIGERLTEEISKQRRIRTIEDELVRKAVQQEQKLKERLTRSVLIKEEVLKLKREKCRMREKYEQEKIKSHKVKERKYLNKCWEQSKSMKRYPSNFNSPSQTSKQKLSVSKLKSPEDPNHKPSRSSLGAQVESLAVEFSSAVKKNKVFVDLRKSKAKNVEKNRLQDFMEKLKGWNAQKEKEKIQDMGTKLQKIDDSRRRRRSLEDQKRKSFHEFLLFQKERKKEANQKSNKERKQSNKTCKSPVLQVHSQHYHKWQSGNRRRQEMIMQERMRKGTEYLEKMRKKKEESILSREVEMQSIEKKIYWERRLKNEQL